MMRTEDAIRQKMECMLRLANKARLLSWQMSTDEDEQYVEHLCEKWYYYYEALKWALAMAEDLEHPGDLKEMTRLEAAIKPEENNAVGPQSEGGQHE